MNRENERQQIYNAIDAIRMSESNKDNLRKTLMQSYGEMNGKNEDGLVRNEMAASFRNPWKRYVVVAMMTLCLVGIPTTVYAAYHYQWFSGLFENSIDKEKVLSELETYTNSENIVVETEQYKITLLKNACSQKQKMGLIACSVILKEGNTDFFYLANINGEQNTYLTKEGIVKENLAGTGRKLASFSLIGNDNKEDITSMSLFCDGQQAEDGGYLINISYSAFDTEMPEKLQLVVSEGDANREIIAEIAMPKTEELPTATFQCKENNDWKIELSAIGITFMDIQEGDKLYKNVVETEGQFWRNHTVLQFGDEEKFLAELGRSNASEERSETYSFYQEFSILIDVDEVKSIMIDDYEFKKIQ